MPENSSIDRQFERLLQYGIAAVKGKDLNTARRWLEKATRLKPADARSWLWLSATTDDLEQRRSYLERAVATDPANAAARRGLVKLLERSRNQRFLEEGQIPEHGPPLEPEDSTAVNFRCPKCGGRLNFEIQSEEMKCLHCGYSKAVDRSHTSPIGEQPIDFTLPTTSGHIWAAAQQRVSCQNCGSEILLPPEQRSDRCPYCGSNRLIEPQHKEDLIDPQLILVMKLNLAEALKISQKWLGNGLLAPDNLAGDAQKIAIHPAYFPFWTFDGTLEIPWRCEINEGSRDHPRWISRHGTEFEFFDDILIPGMRKLPHALVNAIEPFPLEQSIPFSPDYLVGWPALNYDIPMSDASLLAREKVIKTVLRSLHHKIEPGRDKRNLDHGAGKWSGMTFKNILLPLWVGNYEYQGKAYRIFINGVTGKISGSKPRDTTKLILVIFIIITSLALLTLIILWMINR